LPKKKIAEQEAVVSGNQGVPSLGSETRMLCRNVISSGRKSHTALAGASSDKAAFPEQARQQSERDLTR
jgi:hypothetical protein